MKAQVVGLEIKKVGEKDIAAVTKIVVSEFPYSGLTPERTKFRLESGKIFGFKAEERGKLMGYLELELIETEIARINCLALVEGSRGKGWGKKLLEFGINFLQGKGVKRIVLLVKQENRTAKKIYKEAGFDFVGLYHRQIDGATVEEFELDLAPEEENPTYVG